MKNWEELIPIQLATHCLSAARPDVTAHVKTGRLADIQDAEVCAEVAHDFQMNRARLEPPSAETPVSEGWIWAPIRRSWQEGIYTGISSARAKPRNRCHRKGETNCDWICDQGKQSQRGGAVLFHAKMSDRNF